MDLFRAQLSFDNNLNVFCFFFCSDDIRNEIKALKKEYKSDKKSREVKDEQPEKSNEKESDNEVVQSYLSEQRKYSDLKKDVPKKGAAR